MNHVLCVEIYWTYSWYLKSLLLFSTYVSYGLKVFWFPFYRIFASKYEKCLQLSNTAFHACFNAFHPHPISYFSSWFTHQQTHNQHILAYTPTNKLIHTHANTATHTISLFLSPLLLSVYIISLVKSYSESHSHSRSVPI